jgi:hypothetical protein
MNTQAAGGFAFSTPGTSNGDPDEFGPYRIADKPMKRVGIVPMAADSRHNIPFQKGRRAQVASVSCKDRRNFHRAAVKLYCMSPDCVGKSWDTMAGLVAAHPPHLVMQQEQQVHLVFGWSEDPCNPPDEACADCTRATKAASAKATAAAREKSKDAPEVEAPTPCAKHAGGVIGLVTPHDPNVPS